MEFEDINDIAVFTPGVWNGKPYSAAYLRWLYQNYLKYSTGPKAEFTPWLNINHEPNFSFGEVRRLRFAENGHQGKPTLYVDARVPKEVADMVRTGALRQPSIEFLAPTKDAKTGQMLGYYNSQGQLESGPVFECLSFLGNELPGVKGLPPLPQPERNRFRDQSAARRTFGATTMDRQGMLDALAKLGFDTSMITEVVPDALLKSILDTVQKLTAAPVDASNGNGTDAPAVQMADATAGVDMNKLMADALAGTTTTPPVAGAAGTPTPSSVLMKFSDAAAAAIRQRLNGDMQSLLKPLQTTLAQLQAGSAALSREQNDRIKEIRAGAINRFFDEMASSNQITPAMQPGIRAMLEKCDHTARRKFAAAATVGTELEERMSEIASTYPKQRGTTPQVSQPGVKPPPTGNGNNAARSEVVQRAISGMMSKNAQTALAKLNAGKNN